MAEDQLHVLYTAGYAGRRPEQLAAQLLAMNALLIDIRFTPASRLAGWSRSELQRRFGSDYTHMAGLGNRNYRGGPIELAAPEACVPIIRKHLEQRPVVLLCACASYVRCHRRVAAELLRERLGCTSEELPMPMASLVAGEIPVLTLTQPWASLMALGLKAIETRSWGTAYRGLLGIHTAKGVTPLGGERKFRALCASEPYASLLEQHGITDARQLPRGAIVAVVRLVNVAATETVAEGISDIEYALGDYSDGRFAWITEDLRRLDPPIAARGGQGLWSIALAELGLEVA